MRPSTQEHLIHRYLLGDLSDEERLALERDYFTNSETFERAWDTENELVDRYVQGRLSRDEKNLFEQNYLASPVHRARVKFATALLETVDSAAEKDQAARALGPPMSWWATFLGSLRGNRWQWAAIAAVVMLAAFSIVLLAERARLHRQIIQLRAEESSEQQRTRQLENELEAQRDQSDKLAGEIARLHEGQRNVERPSELLQNEARSVLSLVLSPMLMRSESEVQQLKLTRETAAVLLQMKVQQPEARAYRVDLRTVDGASVWSTFSVKVRSSAKDRSTISVSIPASRLDTSEYILTLSATTDTNQTEEINKYFFRVSKE